MTQSRRPAPVTPPVALTIAGSDSGGGAGIQADLKTMEAHGVHATSAITSVTAQHTRGVESTHVLPVAEVTAQIDAVVDDLGVDAVKTGLLATAPIVNAVTDRVADLDVPVVVDPVMVAASGDRLLDPEAETAYESLLATATLVTPNADEAAVLTDVTPTDETSMRAAGDRLLELGADAALVKGGHVGDGPVLDLLVTTSGVHEFTHPRVATDATHGSGCTLSSAIAAALADGADLETAVDGATDFMERAVRYPLDVGEGPGAVHHLVGLRNDAAREPTAEAVQGVVDRFVAADVAPIVPEVGMNVVGATPYAEAVPETAAVEGRITRTLSGVHPNRGVRFGASSHVARFLLAAREYAPSLRFAVDCRFGDAVVAALDDLGWPRAEFDRGDQPADVRDAEGSTMGWSARLVFEDADPMPTAVIDRGAVGKEAIVKLVGESADVVADRGIALRDAVAAHRA